MGIDQEITKREEPDVIFRIYGDDTLLYETDVMDADSPMEFISADVSGVRELKLVADELEHNWSDHVDFADAKLTSVYPGEDEIYVVRYRAVPKAGGSVSAGTSETKTTNGFIGVSEADEAVLTAQAAPGYTFTGWYGQDGSLYTAELSLTVRGFEHAGLYTAMFTASNRAQLINAVRAAEQKDLSGYTAQSADAFRAALSAAQRLLEDNGASPAAIEAALSALAGAQAGLKPVPAPALPDGGTKEPAKTVPAKGTSFETGGFRFLVTKSDAKKGTVSLVKATGRKKAKLTVPATVRTDGFQFAVTKIAQNAFRKNTKLTGITIGKNVAAIGANAFQGCKKLKNITFQGKKAPSVGSKAFKGISAKSKITVPKKMSSTQLRKLKKRMESADIGRKAVYRAK